jgi:hypothetical protein
MLGPLFLSCSGKQQCIYYFNSGKILDRISLSFIKALCTVASLMFIDNRIFSNSPNNIWNSKAFLLPVLFTNRILLPGAFCFAGMSLLLFTGTLPATMLFLLLTIYAAISFDKLGFLTECCADLSNTKCRPGTKIH